MVWDVASGALVARLRGHIDDIQDISFHPDGTLIASSDRGGIVRVWSIEGEPPGFSEARGGEWLPAFQATDDRVWSLAFSADGSRLVTAGRDGSLRVWERPDRTSLVHASDIRWPCAAFTSDGELVLQETEGWAVWNHRTGEMRKSQPTGRQHGWMAIAPEGQTIVTGHEKGILQVWNTAAGVTLQSLSIDVPRVFQLTTDSQGKRLYVTSPDATDVFRWDLETGEALTAWPIGTFEAAIAASADGRWVAVAVLDEIHLYNALIGTVVHVLRGHTNTPSSFAFSNDGKYLASAGHDRKVMIWHIESGVSVHEIRAHDDKIDVVVFSPDGRTIASGDRGGVMTLAHVETGRLLLRVDLTQYWKDSAARERPLSEVHALCFSPDGFELAAGVATYGYVVLNCRRKGEPGARATHVTMR